MPVGCRSLPTGLPHAVLAGHDCAVSSVAFSPNVQHPWLMSIGQVEEQSNSGIDVALTAAFNDFRHAWPWSHPAVASCRCILPLRPADRIKPIQESSLPLP